MSDGGRELFLFILGGGIALIVALFRSMGRRSISRMPCSTIAAFQGGSKGTIVGTARFCGEPLYAPITNRACIYYELIVEEKEYNEGITWKGILHEKKGRDFFLDDSTGRAVVDMSSARVETTARFLELEHATPQVEALLDHRGKGEHSSRGELRYKERILSAGQQLVVYGWGDWKSSPYPALDHDRLHESTRRLVMTSGAVPLVVSDEPTQR